MLLLPSLAKPMLRLPRLANPKLAAAPVTEAHVRAAEVAATDVVARRHCRAEELKLPRLAPPKFQCPTLALPKLRYPMLALPELDLPILPLPKFQSPTLPLPKLKLPTLPPLLNGSTDHPGDPPKLNSGADIAVAQVEVAGVSMAHIPVSMLAKPMLCGNEVNRSIPEVFGVTFPMPETTSATVPPPVPPLYETRNGITGIQQARQQATHVEAPELDPARYVAMLNRPELPAP